MVQRVHSKRHIWMTFEELHNIMYLIITLTACSNDRFREDLTMTKNLYPYNVCTVDT